MTESLPKGRLAKVITPALVTTSYTYDPVTGRKATITDGNNHPVKYDYNSNGLITKFWDAKTPVTDTPTTAYAYYPNNTDLWTETNGLGSVIYEYNTAHDITAVTDRMGVRTELGYNGYGQLTTVTEAKGTPIERPFSFTYNASAHTSPTSKGQALS